MNPALVAILVVVVVLICGSVRVVKQAQAYVIERLGTYTGTWQTGLHVKIPIFAPIFILLFRRNMVNKENHPILHRYSG